MSLNYTLGIDLGASSIGWALVREKALPTSNENIVAGVRVFPAGTDNEKDVEKSKCIDRRVARGMRRQHQRKTQRRNRVTLVLVNAGLWPRNTQKQKELLLHPVMPDGTRDIYAVYNLRARALDETLTPYEIGRALIHLSQRRGFKSNRKIDNTDEKETGKVKEGIGRIRAAMEETSSRTLGEFFAKHTGVADIAARRGNYTDRKMIEDEFNQIWDAQAPHHPEIMTDKNREQIHEAIFFQRPFDKDSEDKIGHCVYIPEEKRARLGHRLVQRYRIWQEIANLRYNANDGQGEQSLSTENRRKIFEALDQATKITFVKIKKIVGLSEDSVFNLETKGKRKELKGNESEAKLSRLFPEWNKLDEDERNARCEAILSLSDEELAAKARKEWGANDDKVAEILKVVLTAKTGSVSLAAVKLLLPHFEAGLDLTGALEKEGLGQSHIELEEGCNQLPLPDMDKLMITNPVVRTSLFQVRKIVNAIIAKYGKPKRIVVEFARDTKGSIEERNEKHTENRRLEKENESIRKRLIDEYKIVDPHKTDIVKYKLWKECDGICPYCGKELSPQEVFHTGEAQIEHIIPYSISFNDSYANKTLACHKCNLEKSARIPYQVWGQDEKRFGEIIGRVKLFQSEFRWTKVNKFEKKEIDETKAPERLLNDTRYMCRVVREFLQQLYSGTGSQRDQFVRVCTGSLTAKLRHHWGLNKILDVENNIKNRDDHRHHAVDAIVIALTNQTMVENLARWSQQRERRESPIFDAPKPFRAESRDPEQETQEFLRQAQQAIDKINVSHKPTRRVRGQLHNETNYGKIDENTYVVRKPLSALTANDAKSIRDPQIRELILNCLKQHGVDVNTKKSPENKVVQNALNAQPIYMTADGKPNGKAPQIKKVRVTVPLSKAIEFKNSDGEAYTYCDPDNNHHMEVFEFIDEKGKLKREARVVTLFEARRRVNAGESVVSRVHPTRPEAKLYTWFCKNDIVEVQDKDGSMKLCRIQKLSGSSEFSSKFNVYFRLHTAATIDDKESLILISSCSPDKLVMQKKTVSPLGELSDDNG
ncbi:MAG: type II CRISPR RNA-guided endonuclease Cas9 [Candidatus Sumerlaeales bacterium]|nr:type II CRISPR RNA-guided endonuclease Cas9 [Candidatus Sumerlaeales bacterium]